jgi:hypothetical protein
VACIRLEYVSPRALPEDALGVQPFTARKRKDKEDKVISNRQRDTMIKAKKRLPL